jgi:sugar diacid utilization regulator
VSAIADRPVHARGPVVDSHEQEYREALTALSELSAVPADGNVDELLRRIIERACAVLQVRRCGLYLRDDPREVFVGRVAHPREEIEAAVRDLTLGGPTDIITQELVETGKPLVIRDAYGDPRAARAAIRAWKVRCLLGVPIVASGQVIGVLIFDNGADVHPFAPPDIDVATAMAAITAHAVTHARFTDELKTKVETTSRQNLLLRKTMTAEHRLSGALLSGGGLSAIVELVANLTGKPTALYDSHGQPVVKASAPGGCELEVCLLEDLQSDEGPASVFRDVVAGSCVSVGPTLTAGIRHRHIAAPVDVGGQRWGWLVVMENPTRFTAFDEFITRRAATHLALELGGRRQLNTSTSDARASFARQLLRGGEDREEMRRSAEYLGIDLEVPRVVGYVSGRSPGGGVPIGTERLVADLREHVSGEVLATNGTEGVALVIELARPEPARIALQAVKAALRDACARLGADAEIVIGLSCICREPAAVAHAYREAREVARCVGSFAGTSSQRVLGADDLGPARLFVTNVNSDAAERFVADSVGPLLGGGEQTDDLLRTLEAFYDAGRSVRVSSERLGVHENTIRYRLARVHTLTGLDVAADADDQLTAQVALLVLRLQGHSVLRRFASDTREPAEPVTPPPAAALCE